jgi:hypothetical protein
LQAPLVYFKKAQRRAIRLGATVIALLSHLADQGKCGLLYFDASGFSPDPLACDGWPRAGQLHWVAHQSPRQRLNVLSALRQNGEREWSALQYATVRTDVVVFRKAGKSTARRLVSLSSPILRLIKGRDGAEASALGAERAVLVLPAAVLPGTQSPRNAMETGQVLLRRFVSLDGCAFLV